MVKVLPPRFTNESAARRHLERLQWPNGPICPHCQVEGRSSRIKGGRLGLLFCGACRKQYSVTVGTVFERSKIPLHIWLYANHLLCSSKKGISSHQLARMLGVTYKTAWFMAHRIRTAMAPLEGSEPPLGGEGKIVEGDDTELSLSHKTDAPARKSRGRNPRFMTLIERGGRAKSVILNEKNSKIIGVAAMGIIDRASTLHTDGGKGYRSVVPADQHEVVIHKDEYARDGKSGRVHTNSAEGFFSIFKRGLVGTYQHMSEQHLPRYLAEFDFRMNYRAAVGCDDAVRADIALEGIRGKRLTYRTTTA